ncbi:MAG: TetR/AcrR family transcriptional regulator C-terminal domain-containing protein [Gammaproteobacteria bacterium]
MVDAIYGETLSTRTRSGDWRRALRSMANATRRAAERHPWFVELLGGRPHQGPNALAYHGARSWHAECGAWIRRHRHRVDRRENGERLPDRSYPQRARGTGCRA